MLELHNVHKSFGEIHAVSDVSFTVRPGEILGLLGPNGAGKSTLMRLLSGYYYPDTGSILYDGTAIADNLPEYQSHTGYLPENAPLYEDLTVQQSLEFHASARMQTKAEKKRAVDFAVESAELQDVYVRPINQLSKGFRQRIAFAQAIMHNPDLLILDEPSSGLDPNQIQQFRALIKRYARAKTVIISSHIMQEVEALCHRLLIMNQGKVSASGELSQLRDSNAESLVFSVRFSRFDDELIHSLAKSHGVTAVSAQGERHNISFDPGIFDEDSASEFLFNFCVTRSIQLRELTRVQLSLEQTFMKYAGPSGNKESGGRH